MNKLERLEKANQFLVTLASCGRRFFAYSDRVARFELDNRGRVWFIDSYAETRIYTHHPGYWLRFSNGATLKWLVEKLRDFIFKGKLLPDNILGPWPEEVCNGDLWGYGSEMDKVRETAVKLGLVRSTSKY